MSEADGTARQTVSIVHDVGLHARPAAQFVKAAGAFDAEVTVSYGDRTANAKSLVQILKLEAGHRAEVTVSARGDDAHAAVAALSRMLAEVDAVEPAPAD